MYMNYYDKINDDQRSFTAANLRERIVGYKWTYNNTEYIQTRVSSFSGKDSFDSILYSCIDDKEFCTEYKIKSASTEWKKVIREGVMIKQDKYERFIAAAKKEGLQPLYVNFFTISKTITIHNLYQCDFDIITNFVRQSDKGYNTGKQEASIMYMLPLSSATIIHWTGMKTMDEYNLITKKDLCRRFNDQRWMNVNLNKSCFR
jgi:hypothetical protein